MQFKGNENNPNKCTDFNSMRATLYDSIKAAKSLFYCVFKEVVKVTCKKYITLHFIDTQLKLAFTMKVENLSKKLYIYRKREF